MSNFEPHQIGKWLILAGLVIVVVGLLIMLLGRFGLFRLPGDVTIEGKNWRIYLPLTSSVVLSIILTLLLLLITYFRR